MSDEQEQMQARVNVLSLKVEALLRISQEQQSKISMLFQRLHGTPPTSMPQHNISPPTPVNTKEMPVRNIKAAQEMGATLAKRVGIDPKRVFAPTRRVTPNVAMVRKALTFRLRAWNWSYSELASLFNLKDHTTVIHYSKCADETLDLFMTPIVQME